MSTAHANVYEAVAAAMLDVGGVAKSRTNEMQRFKYRGIADVSLACQPAMAKHGLCIAPYEIHKEEWGTLATKNGGSMSHCLQRIEFRCYHGSGTYITVMVTGEATDSGDKTANKVMAVALKYALCQLFCIPEDDPEIDTDAHSPGEQLAPRPATKPAGAPAEKPAFPRITMPQAVALGKAIGEFLPKATSAERAAYVSWAVGRAVDSPGHLNTAEATLLRGKMEAGEMPPVEVSR